MNYKKATDMNGWDEPQRSTWDPKWQDWHEGALFERTASWQTRGHCLATAVMRLVSLLEQLWQTLKSQASRQLSEHSKLIILAFLSVTDPAKVWMLSIMPSTIVITNATMTIPYQIQVSPGLKKIQHPPFPPFPSPGPTYWIIAGLALMELKSD